jgi:hypothetical protein
VLRRPVEAAGNGWTLNEDFAAAQSLRPAVPVIAVNGAAGVVKAQFLFSIHFEKLPRWIALQTDRFGAGFSVHGVGSEILAKQAQRRRDGPFVNYWWPDARSAGTSAWGAAKLARVLGFEEIILCGVPLAEGTYSDGSLANDFMRPKILDHYRRAVLADTGWHAGVRSFSGWTREVFGEPN